METELWNLDVRRNDLTAYIRRFQELVLLCTRMVPDEEDKVERFIGGLPDNIQGNVIDAEPTRLQEAIRISNNLMDQKLKGYARSAKKREGLTITRGTTVGSNQFLRDKMLEVRMLQELTQKETMRERDCTAAVTPNNQRAPVRNQPGVVCYECGRPGHYRKDCPKLRNQNHGNKTRNKTGNKTGNNEATTKAYVIIGGG
ncbi:putative reverse transcriptase domain-containing protein [Tanacetum coccineum]